MSGLYTVSDLKDLKLKIQGSEPTSGFVFVKENVLKSGCLTIDDYKIIIDSNSSVAELGECTEQDILGYIQVARTIDNVKH